MVAEGFSVLLLDKASVRVISFSTFRTDTGWEDKRKASR